ncbi:MAG: hypothetical protein ACI89X_003679 [Planctomycetota bacterium]|jgi:hypothetical protein
MLKVLLETPAHIAINQGIEPTAMRSQRTMAKYVCALWLSSLAVVTGCRQLATPDQDNASAQARYVDVATLTSGAAHSGGDVITSVPLHHITALDAEAGLRSDLPASVRVARVGQSKSVLLQGPAQAVVAAIKTLKTLDVR